VVLRCPWRPARFGLGLDGGYAFCGTDTTEPGKFGDWACGTLVHPVAPWAAIVATPIAALLVGGSIALRRRDWRLFTFVLIVPPVLLVSGFFTLTALSEL